jgi:hypothetical protein
MRKIATIAAAAVLASLTSSPAAAQSLSSPPSQSPAAPQPATRNDSPPKPPVATGIVAADAPPAAQLPAVSPTPQTQQTLRTMTGERAGTQLAVPVPGALEQLQTRPGVDPRLARINLARAQLQLPPVDTAPPAAARLSPAAPGRENEHAILMARARTYLGPAPNRRDGAFVLNAAGPNGAGDFVHLAFPTEAGRRYVLDCAVTAASRPPVVRFSSQVGAPVTESATATDGRVMVVVRATSTLTTRVLQADIDGWQWTSCEIAPTA